MCFIIDLRFILNRFGLAVGPSFVFLNYVVLFVKDVPLEEFRAWLQKTIPNTCHKPSIGLADPSFDV